MRVSASIVIYNEKKETLKKAVDSFLALDLEKELVLVDNSEHNLLKEFCESFTNVTYIHSGNNIGFGSAHNLAFNSLSQKSDVHVVINPDVYFDKSIQELILWTKESDNISLSVPKVYFPDGTYQNTVRKIPKAITLFKRKLNIKSDEFQESDFSKISEIPFAHGCFFVFKTDVYKKISGFDERFFMYMEDIDIFIKAKEFGKTVLHPEYKIYHEYRKGSSKNRKLFLFHIQSAIKFFSKHPKHFF